MAGIVLAGGLSRRMGEPKAFIELAGARLIDRAVGTLGEVASPVYVVAPRPDPRLTASGAVFAEDMYPDQGPVGGIVTGLLAAGPGRHAVLACDMPFVPAVALLRLLALAQGHLAALALGPLGPEPLCAAYGFGAASVLRASIESGERKALAAAIRLAPLLVPLAELGIDDPDMVASLNTPEDLERARTRMSGEGR